MKNNLVISFASTALLSLAVVASLASFSSGAQESKAVSLKVATIGVPIYPPLARAAHVEGTVHIKITTDGQRVIGTHVEDGHKLLAAAAEENAKSWQFTANGPATFIVTYRYKLVPGLKGDPSSPAITLRLPNEVQVSTVPLVISDPGAQVK
jgi:outer membrane biosynthesis protein TonB